MAEQHNKGFVSDELKTTHIDLHFNLGKKDVMPKSATYEEALDIIGK